MISFSELADASPGTPSAGLLEIDLDAVRANYRLLRGLVGNAVCGGVVKADSYGLGADRVVPALAREGCRHFFVAHADEALALLPCLPNGGILYVLNGLTGDAVPEIARRLAEGAPVVPVLNSLGHVIVWREAAARLGRVLPAVLQIDTGMSRLGLAPVDVAAVAGDGAAFAGLDIRFVMSHLACADEPLHPASAAQLGAFNAARDVLARHGAFAGARWSLANSSGIFLGAGYHFDLVRPGAALYGLNPQPGGDNPMRAVVRLRARIIQTRSIPAGSHVGYGYTFESTGAARVATLSVGYADGWPRSLSGRGAAWLGDHRLPILGRVSMDSVVVDVSHVPAGLAVADAPVELIGGHQTVDDVAEAAGTIGYEILTSLGRRYRRVYIGG